MSKSTVGLSMALALLASTTAAAQSSWNFRSEVGFVAARGNSSSDSANAKVQIVREVNRWKYTLETSGLYGQSASITSAQRVDGRLQVDKSFGERERWFWFGAGRYEDDRFSGFDYQSTVTTGLGHKFIDTDRTKLTLQVGAGYRQLRPELLVRDETGAVIARVPGERDADAVVNGSLNFQYDFNDHTRLLDSLLTESGEANTLARNDLALEVKMIKTLALSLGVSVRHNSVPQNGLKRTDTLTTVNLVYLKGSTQ
jgi:putative salt-induced outer membrane protein